MHYYCYICFVFVDVPSAYVFTSVFLLGGRVDVATLLDVLNSPHCFTSILIVGVSVACTYVAALLLLHLLMLLLYFCCMYLCCCSTSEGCFKPGCRYSCPGF